METGLQLGSELLQVGSQMMDLIWSNKDPSNKAVSIFETVITKIIILIKLILSYCINQLSILFN